MRHSLLGLLLAGGMFLGTTSDAKAQIGISVGQPLGMGLGLGAPYSSYSMYSSYYGSPLVGTSYSSGYTGMVGPAAVGYSPAYVGPGAYGIGYAPRYYGPAVYSPAVYAPAYGYPAAVIRPRGYWAGRRGLRGW
ncbi:hypothetical protein ACYOEI_22445 [Singulisphaera rosea]